MKVKFIIKSIPQIQTQSTNKISTSSRYTTPSDYNDREVIRK